VHCVLIYDSSSRCEERARPGHSSVSAARRGRPISTASLHSCVCSTTFETFSWLCILTSSIPHRSILVTTSMTTSALLGPRSTHRLSKSRLCRSPSAPALIVSRTPPLCKPDTLCKPPQGGVSRDFTAAEKAIKLWNASRNQKLMSSISDIALSTKKHEVYMHEPWGPVLMFCFFKSWALEQWPRCNFGVNFAPA
jgi:hypothetical protein